MTGQEQLRDVLAAAAALGRVNVPYLCRRAAVYVDKIIKGGWRVGGSSLASSSVTNRRRSRHLVDAL